MSSQTKPTHWRNHLQRQPAVWPGLGGIYLTINSLTVVKGTVSKPEKWAWCLHSPTRTYRRAAPCFRKPQHQCVQLQLHPGNPVIRAQLCTTIYIASPLTPRNIKTRCPVRKDSGRREERDVSLIEIFTNFIQHPALWKFNTLCKELIKHHNAYKAKRLSWHSWSEHSHSQSATIWSFLRGKFFVLECNYY